MSEELSVSGDQMGAAASVVMTMQDPASAGQQGEHSVPLAALQAERAQRQKLQDELQMVKDHVMLLQSNQSRMQEPVAPHPLSNLQDNDVMTYGEFKKAADQFNQQIQTKLNALEVSRKYPDYNEVIQHLPEVINKNPGLRASLEQTQDYELAYYLAKNSDTYRSQSRSVNINSDAQRIVENAQRAGSLSSVGGVSAVNKAKSYKSMSDTEFKELVSRNLGGG